jgi:hypothetical protein
LLGALAGYAAEAASVADSFNGQSGHIESELVSPVEAMPAQKFGFARIIREFKGVRTFAEQPPTRRS